MAHNLQDKISYTGETTQRISKTRAPQEKHMTNTVTGWVEKSTDLKDITESLLENVRTEVLQGSIAQYQAVYGNSNCKKIAVTILVKEIQ
jgi:hypothetical protein